MDTIKKINDEVAIAGQLSPEQLEQIAQDGYRTILNLRSRDERGFLDNEKQLTEQRGVLYLNTPVNLKELTSQTARYVLQQICQAPKPLLLHCDTGVRSATFAVIYIVTKQGTDLEQALQRTMKPGLL